MHEPRPQGPHSEPTFTNAMDMSELQPVEVEVKPSELSSEELEDLIFEDPRVVSKLAEIKEARDSGRGGRAQDLVIEQKALVQTVKDEILKSRGEYVDPEVELAKAEEHRLKEVFEISASLNGEENEQELLQAYRLVDSEGQLTKESIQSPLFHTFTKNAFHHYLTMVDKFNSMSEAESQYSFGLKGIGKADADRTVAHDAVAKLVGEDLSMEFMVARRLVAKMRDEIFPGSGETSRYAMAVRRGEKLAERYGNDVSRVVGEELRHIEHAVEDAHEYHAKHSH